MLACEASVCFKVPFYMFALHVVPCAVLVSVQSACRAASFGFQRDFNEIGP